MVGDDAIHFFLYRDCLIQVTSDALVPKWITGVRMAGLCWIGLSTRHRRISSPKAAWSSPCSDSLGCSAHWRSWGLPVSSRV